MVYPNLLGNAAGERCELSGTGFSRVICTGAAGLVRGLVEIYCVIGCASTRTGFRRSRVRLSGSRPRRESRRQRLGDSVGGMREMEKSEN